MDFLVGVFICAPTGTNIIQIAYSLELDERNQALAVRHDHGSFESPLKTRSGFINQDLTPGSIGFNKGRHEWLR